VTGEDPDVPERSLKPGCRQTKKLRRAVTLRWERLSGRGCPL